MERYCTMKMPSIGKIYATPVEYISRIIIYEFNKRVPATEKKARYPPAAVRRPA